MRGQKRPTWFRAPVTQADDMSMRAIVLRELGSDAFMPLLGRFPQIAHLEIGPHTTDAGFASLPDLPHVKQLTLSPHLTDASIPRLKRFRGLSRLHNGGARISVDALLAAGVLDTVDDLVLRVSEPDAAAWQLAKGAGRTSISSLWLGRAATDGCVDALIRLASLRRLWLCDHTLSAEGRATLRAALPQTHIGGTARASRPGGPAGAD